MEDCDNLGSIGILWLLSSSRILKIQLEKIVRKALQKHTDLGIRDYASLLHLFGDYEIHELEVKENDWLGGKNLGELDLLSEGVTVLAINKPNGDYVGVPNAESTIEAGDHLIIYGREENLAELDKRKKGSEGDEGHKKAKAKQRRVELKQERQQRGREANKNK